ncbi:bifunctional tetrahydrofolate synthase/dihydrofolate synthase [Moraxella sp. ZY200743]|uniref:bifunctional tetrahydrofolate synthase/dihydrofolate synthase n=1 Tax=Moraxella sp. ZY200743 TaxID=2911970 RepID=UPI003D7F0DFC
MNTSNQNSPKLTEQDSLSAWLDYIAGIHISAIDMGLERVLPVAKRLGIFKDDSPHRPHVFTVAGTNGKGSTTATIAQICQSVGYKTALYQSPHLVSFTERIKVDGMDIDEPSLVRALANVERVRLECGLSLSFFEMTTLAAFLIFKEKKADVWVLEIGLGGRLDVVNIIDPDVAVITNIDIDHVDWLGHDIDQIGFEKAGIIRPNIPVILGAKKLPSSVLKVAKDNEAKVYQLGVDYDFSEQDESWQYSSSGITLDLPKPNLSLLNAVNAVSAVLASSLDIHPKMIAKALSKASLAGRFDVRQLNARRWLFDVAHNAHGMAFFLEQFVPYWQNHICSHPNAKLHFVFSMLGDKDTGAVLDLVQKRLDDGDFTVATWQVAAINHIRAMPLVDIVKLMQHHLKSAQIITHNHLETATQTAIQASDESDLLVVFGSFHTVSEVLMAILGKSY